MSIRSVIYLSENHAKFITPGKNQAIISITDPGREAELSPLWVKLLRVQFLDSEYNEKDIREFWNVRHSMFAQNIGEHQAVAILNFLEDLDRDSSTIDLFVHCWEGSSRSAAVALHVSERYKLRASGL